MLWYSWICQRFFRSYLTNRRQYTVKYVVNSDLRAVSYEVPHGFVLRPLFFLLYINYLYKSIGHESVRLFDDYTVVIASNSNLSIAQKQACEIFTNLYHWCVANKLSINNDKANSVLFHMKNKPVPKHFICIQTDAKQINRVNSAQYLGMLLDEHLYCDYHVDQICASIVKYFGIYNHIKNFASSRISKQPYYALIYSRIQ